MTVKREKDPIQELLDFQLKARVGTLFIGIDPGTTGAVALLAGKHYTVVDLPVIQVKRGKGKTKAFDLGKILHMFSMIGKGIVCLEKLQGHIPGGRGGAYVGFRMGYAFGMWPLYLMARGCRVHEVRPAIWKKAMKVTADKERSLKLARKLFPKVQSKLMFKKNHDRAEALLMAKYIRKKYNADQTNTFGLPMSQAPGNKVRPGNDHRGGDRRRKVGRNAKSRPG